MHLGCSPETNGIFKAAILSMFGILMRLGVDLKTCPRRHRPTNWQQRGCHLSDSQENPNKSSAERTVSTDLKRYGKRHVFRGIPVQTRTWKKKRNHNNNNNNNNSSKMFFSSGWCTCSKAMRLRILASER